MTMTHYPKCSSDAVLWFIWILSIACISANGNNCPPVSIPNSLLDELWHEGNIVGYLIRCAPPFWIIGSDYTLCTNDTWDPPVPVCAGRNCRPPRATPGLTIEKVPLPRGAQQLKFSCAKGMVLKGPGILTCAGYHWDDYPPTCSESLSLGCDFEEADLCGWSQDSTDEFDWTMYSGPTPTDNTGPDVDYTTNSSKGHYIYIESSPPRKKDHKARLLSPPYPADQIVDKCLMFSYKMYGSTTEGGVGAIDVYVKPQSVSTTSSTLAIFHQEGNKGNCWLRADVDIPTQNETFQIVIEATRPESFTSDIALDDIIIHNCSERLNITTHRCPDSLEPDSITQTITTMQETTAPSTTMERTKPTTTTRATTTTTEAITSTPATTSGPQTTETTTTTPTVSEITSTTTSTTLETTIPSTTGPRKPSKTTEAMTTTGTTTTTTTAPITTAPTKPITLLPPSMKSTKTITPSTTQNKPSQTTTTPTTTTTYIHGNDQHSTTIEDTHEKHEGQGHKNQTANRNTTKELDTGREIGKNHQSQSDSTKSVLAAVLGSVGAVLVVAVVIALVTWKVWKRQRKSQNPSEDHDQITLL